MLEYDNDVLNVFSFYFCFQRTDNLDLSLSVAHNMHNNNNNNNNNHYTSMAEHVSLLLIGNNINNYCVQNILFYVRGSGGDWNGIVL